MKILFISLAGIGNLITQLPVVNKLRRLFPGATLDLLVVRDRGGKEILQGNPAIDHVLELPPLLGTPWIHKLILLWRRTSIGDYDLAITGFPNQGLFSALLMRRVAARGIQHVYQVKNSGECAWLLDNAPRIARKHFVLQNLDLAPGEEKNRRSDFRLDYFETPAEASVAERFLGRPQTAGEKWIGIHPGSFADMTWKRWPGTHWRDLLVLLREERPTSRFFVFGTDADDLGDFPQAEDVIILRKSSLRESASLIKRMSLMISGDSGLGHVASLFQVPQVVLFGGTDPVISRPFSPKAKVLVPEGHDPFYQPHLGLLRPPDRSIERISPQQVAAAVLARL